MFTPKWFVGAERRCIVFRRPYGMFWSLNRGSSLLRYEVIDEFAFLPCLGHWPDLRGHRLTQDLKLGCQWLRVVTSNTLVFNQSSSSIRSQTRGESRQPPPPPPLVPWRMAKWWVPARVKCSRQYSPPEGPLTSRGLSSSIISEAPWSSRLPLHCL